MSRRILIVDDDRDMVRTLSDIFKLRGWDTGQAYSGDEAISAQQAGAYDRVLMDIKMPGLDGIAAHKSLIRMFPKLLVVLMTAHRVADLDYTSAPVITKPIDLPALFAMLET